jgi:septal ring factor EnvC (AmiA/AmiB activator)
MDNLINPEVRDLQQRVSRNEGQIEEIRRVAGDTSRQTIWQFIAFSVVMAGVLIGSSIFQTEALRRETVAKIEAVNQRFEQVNQRFEQVNQRFEQVNQRIEQVEKRLDRIEKSIEALTQEIRAGRRRNGATGSVKSVSVSRRQTSGATSSEFHP